MHSTRPADVRDKTRIRPPPDGAVRAGDRTCDRRLSADNGRDIAPDNNRPMPENAYEHLTTESRRDGDDRGS